jgi:hypothetical protein
MKKLLLFLSVTALTAVALQAQEINASVRINIQKLQQADPRVFETLETAISEFMNDRKWTNDEFEPEERINVNIQLVIQEELSPTSFSADMSVQASRPVFGTDYETPILNFIDKEVTFYYEQYQPIQFSANRFNDNLSSVLAFYAYIILGLDYDSFSLNGGEAQFQEALAIVNNVPESAAAANQGWRSLDGNRNRYWLSENILSPRVRPFRQAWYEYHRQGLDLASKDVATARAIIAAALEQIRSVDNAYPNSMIIQVFSDTKAQEIVEIFKRGTPREQNSVVQIMTRLDATNSNLYREIK